MPDSPSWVATRLVVQADGEMISPVESFTPSFNLNTEVIHSLEQTHLGFINNPATFNFSISLRANGGGSAALTALAIEGGEFELALQKQQDGGEWDFDKIVLRQCRITSANPSNATVNGTPMATFSGVALAAQVDGTEVPSTGS